MTLGDEGRLRAVIRSVVESAGFDLEELTVTVAGRRRVVRVSIDSDDGVDLDQAAEVSRGIAAQLDDAAQPDLPVAADRSDDDAVLAGAPYTLEVSSPGVGRPLTAPRHFRRAAGRMVAFTLNDGSALHARILQVDGDEVVVLTGTSGREQQSIRLSEVGRAKVEVEFSPPSAEVAAMVAEAAGGRTAMDPEEGVDAR